MERKRMTIKDVNDKLEKFISNEFKHAVDEIGSTKSLVKWILGIILGFYSALTVGLILAFIRLMDKLGG